MTTISVSKPPLVIKTEHNIRYHTLHCTKQFVFTVQKNGTSIVAFRNRKDATKFAKLLESHFDLTQTWPNINFEETLMFRSPENMRLKYLDISLWREQELQNFCVKNSFNLLDIHRIEDNFRLVGRSIKWEAPLNMYIEMLNEKLT